VHDLDVFGSVFTLSRMRAVMGTCEPDPDIENFHKNRGLLDYAPDFAVKSTPSGQNPSQLPPTQ
jgi:hypothetical protein